MELPSLSIKEGELLQVPVGLALWMVVGSLFS
jgi:hypothetical protein